VISSSKSWRHFLVRKEKKKKQIVNVGLPNSLSRISFMSSIHSCAYNRFNVELVFCKLVGLRPLILNFKVNEMIESSEVGGFCYR
jgi:hypothetical protein